MRDNLTLISYGLATLASICFVGGLVVLINEGGQDIGQN